jgi:hypothetical protein
MQLSPVTDDLEEAHEWFDVLPEAMGIEGLVVKGASSRYVGSRREWLKVNSVGSTVSGWFPLIESFEVRARIVTGRWCATGVADECPRRSAAPLDSVLSQPGRQPSRLAHDREGE